MEEDTEVLDWGHDDDEQARAPTESRDNWRDPDDAEDAVSLGGDEDDMQDYYAYDVADQDATKVQAASSKPSSSQQQSASQSKREVQREPPATQKPASQTQSSSSPPISRTHSVGKLTHALPPKPVVSLAPIAHPLPAQASTLASSMVQRERRPNGHGKPISSGDALPPDWEMRQPRSGGHDHYYYNVKTHESTWNRPAPVSSRSSPSKERERGGVHGRDERSPARTSLDVKRRSSSSERLATSQSSRKDSKRRASPSGPLSYQDRHYRPNQADAAAGTEISERQDDYDVQPHAEGHYTHTRPSSPRPIADHRRSRSFSPSPRRDFQTQDRAARNHRDLSPPKQEHGMWREAPRDVRNIPPPRLEGPSERNWGASRASDAPEPMSSHVHDERGRGRQRVGIDPSGSQYAPMSREQTSRHSPAEWPAPRHRAPSPHIPGPSGPLPRRFSQGSHENAQILVPFSASTQHRPRTRFDQPDTTVMPPRPQAPQRRFSEYPPADSVPQRRGREYENSESLPELEPKRRRVDDRVGEHPRRSAFPEPSVSSLPERPPAIASSVIQNDQSRSRGRKPLPPQYTQYREVTARPQDQLSRSPNADSNRSGYAESPRHMHESASSRISDVPTDSPAFPHRHPRSQTLGEPRSDLPMRGSMPSRGTVPIRQTSRFDNPSTSSARDYPAHSERDVLSHMNRDPMEVDQSMRVTAPRLDEGPRRTSGMYADRLDMQMDMPPRGPRAMAGKANVPPPYTPPATSPTMSPSTSYSNLRPMHPQESLPPRNRNRLNNEGWGGDRRDRMDVPPIGANYGGMQSNYPPRRYDSGRGAPYERPSDRFDPRADDGHERKQQVIKDQRDFLPRFSPREPDGGSAPSLRVPGAKPAPVGNRKVGVESDLPATRSPVSRRRPSVNSYSDPIAPRPVANDDYEQGNSTADLPPPPTSAYRSPALGPYPNRRRGNSNASRIESSLPDRPPPQLANEYSGNVTRPRNEPQGESRRNRPTRFGPGPGPEHPSAAMPAPSEPRVWFTREESQSLENRGREGNRVDDVPSDRGTWRPYESGDPSSRLNGTGNRMSRLTPGPRSAMNDEPPRLRPDLPTMDRGRADMHPVPSGLEGRLSNAADGSYPAPEERGRPFDPPTHPLPMRPRTHDAYQDVPPRQEFHGTRDQGPYRDGPPGNWDRANLDGFRDASPDGAGRVHPDRARLLSKQPVGSAPPLPATEQDVLMRTSKPVRIRRPQPQPQPQPPAQPPGESFLGAASRESVAMDNVSAVDGASRPGSLRRGASLLDRLSLDDPPPQSDAVSPSLRDRMELYPVRGGVDEAGMAPDDAPVDGEYDGFGNSNGNGLGAGGGELALRAMRGGKRRNTKPKRIRRGGMPA